MKIGKTIPSGAVYTVPEANNRFAKKEAIEGISTDVENLEGQVGDLSTDVEAVQGAIEEFDTMIPTPETADVGKVLTANNTGGYELENPGGGSLVPIPTQADDGKVLTANDSGGYDLETPSSGGLQNLVDGSRQGSVRGINCVPESSSYTMGRESVSLGLNSKSTGPSSFAGGSESTAALESAFAYGYHCESSGISAFSGGYRNVVSAENSLALGAYNIVKGNDSYAIGRNLGVNRARCFILGRNCRQETFINASTASDYVFIVGNGPSASVLNNAFAIKHNGDFEIDDTLLTLQKFKELIAIANATPTTDGTYKLQCTVTNGTPAFSWVADA